jgi:omega-hydroxy-beta-dihydromenaquinone-9 sulfotransferase
MKTARRTSVLFIVGCGRSGTTMLYEILASHSRTAWCSTWSDRIGHPALAIANPLFAWSRRIGIAASVRRWLPAPSEGYRQWDAVLGIPPDKGLAPMTGSQANASHRQALNRMLDRYCLFGRGTLFVNKNTRNSRRIDFLDALVPECVVLHVLRHPLDTVSSLLSVKWWPCLPLWTRGGKCPASLSTDLTKQAELAAELWVAEVHRARIDGARLGSSRYFEISYEDLVTAPSEAISPVLARFELDPQDSHFSAALSRVRTSSVGVWRDRLDSRQQSVAWSLVAPLAQVVGYAA